MANFSALKTAIQNAIKQNGNEEITGDVLQQILLSIVNTMGDGSINTIEQNLSNETLARQNGDNTLQSNINAEALARGNADTQLQNAINAIKANIDNGYVYAGIATPSSTPVSGKVFYVATAAGTYTNFGGQVLTQGINILRYNGSAWSNQQLIGIDDVPTAGSNSLVKSGGVQNELALGAVYDVSAKNPTAGPNNDGKWESLSALLSDANLNTLIPTAYRKGGMSIKFVHTNDNKYVQYLLTKNTWSTSEADWEKVNLEEEVSQLGQTIDGLSNNPTVILGNGWMNTSGNCVYFNTSKHAVIAIAEGMRIQITTTTEKQSVLAFLSDYENITQDGQSYYVIGERITAMGQIELIAPQNSKYLFVGIIGNNQNLIPSAIVIESYDYRKPIVENLQEAFSQSKDVPNIKQALFGFTDDITLSQGYATANISFSHISVGILATRVKTIIINGNYNIKTNPGFVIRGIAAWNGGKSSGTLEQTTPVDDCANIVSGAELTEYTKKDNWDSSVITFCKADASADILPTEDIIAEFTPIGLVERVNILEQSETNPVIKKAVFMGDSITHGVYSYWYNNIHEETDRYNGFDITNLNSVEEATAYHGIPYYFGLLAKCPNPVINLGKRGSGYVADTRNIGNALVVATNYDFSDVDFVALCFGVNDYIQGKTIGDILTKEPGTIIGNMCATIEKILTDNPLCKVVVYSPYNTWGQVSYGGDYTSNVLYGDEGTNYALGHPINGNTLQDFINAEYEVCMFYGIQHVKLSKSNVVNRFTIKNIMIDGLHPSKDAYIKLAAEIYGKGNFGD